MALKSAVWFFDVDVRQMAFCPDGVSHISAYLPKASDESFWGTGMIASSSTFRPHPGRVIGDLNSIVQKH